MAWNNSKKVALVGRRLSGNENLGLGYLKTALNNAGYRVQVEYINRGDDLERIAQIVTSGSFFMVGLSLSDGGSSFLPLGLGELLRRRGYRGHITTGGHFATLADEWLLERHSWLDSVVRFAGEVPIVNLADRLIAKKSTRALPGVRTRSGPGLPAPVLDGTPMKLWPTRDVKPEILGYGVAQVSGTRGCKGRCTYCGPAAIQSREKAEARALGASLEDISRCGVGGVRRRDLGDLCDEMAELWHKDRIRYFYLVDEHMLPYSEPEALDYLDTWRRGLERRKVGRFGIGLMLRAERISEAIIERFKQVGLIRCFVGLELATKEEGTTFGRRIDPDHNLRILEAFNRLGMETVSNLMLVHPYSTIDTVSSALQYLRRIRTGLFETTRMMPYHGTRLADRLKREGRLDGNPLRYGYGFDDPKMTRFVQTFARLRGKAFRDYSLAYYAHDVFVSMALAKHLYPQKPMGLLTERVERVRDRINQTYVSCYETALALAIQGDDIAREDFLVAAATKQVRSIQTELALVDARLNAMLADDVKRYSPLAGAAAAVFAFSMMGSSIGGCSQLHGDDRDGGMETDTDKDTGGGTDSDTASDLQCDGQKMDEQKAEIIKNVSAEVPCFDGKLWFEESGKVRAMANVYSAGRLEICQDEELVEVLEADAEKAALDTEPNCVQGFVTVEGSLAEDLQRLENAVGESCDIGWDASPNDFTVHLDAEGFVSDVTPNDPSQLETAECIHAALKGLQFPCLANFDICPEYLIAE